MKFGRYAIRGAVAAALVLSVVQPGSSDATTQPEGIVIVNACHRFSGTQGPITDGDFTVSAGADLFEISESLTLSKTMGTGGVSWARDDRSGRYYSWRSNSYLILTCTGNLQFWHAPGILLWQSNTAGSHGAHLILNAAGELRLYTADWSRMVWRSWSGARFLGPGSVLPSGGRMASSGEMRNDWTQHTLRMQRDGNLVYRVGGVVRWQTGTHVPGAHALLTRNGELEIIGPAGNVRWSSHVSGNRTCALDVQHMRIDQYGWNALAHTIWQAPGVS